MDKLRKIMEKYEEAMNKVEGATEENKSIINEMKSMDQEMKKVKESLGETKSVQLEIIKVVGDHENEISSKKMAMTEKEAGRDNEEELRIINELIEGNRMAKKTMEQMDYLTKRAELVSDRMSVDRVKKEEQKDQKKGRNLGK